MEVDLALAWELAEITNPIPKACWRNSLNALAALRMSKQGKQKEAIYVEGWLVIADGQLPIEHGWLEVDGKIADVTLAGEYQGDKYHPVFRYPYDDIWQAMDRYGMLPFFRRAKGGQEAMDDAYFNLPGFDMLELALAEAFRKGIEDVAKHKSRGRKKIRQFGGSQPPDCDRVGQRNRGASRAGTGTAGA